MLKIRKNEYILKMMIAIALYCHVSIYKHTIMFDAIR